MDKKNSAQKRAEGRRNMADAAATPATQRPKSSRYRGDNWQAQKSDIMRQRILDATIRCLIRLGYALTTTTEIAAEAGVSRGAMVHHFSNKSQLMQAAIEHLAHKRVESFRLELAKVAHAQDHTAAGIEAYWRHLSNPLFVAFHELTFAARIEPELEATLKPAIDRFNKEWYQAALAAFPEWQDKGPLFDLAMDLTQFLMEGMAVNTLINAQDERFARTRRYLVARLKELLGDAKSSDSAVSLYVEERKTGPRKKAAGARQRSVA